MQLLRGTSLRCPPFRHRGCWAFVVFFFFVFFLLYMGRFLVQLLIPCPNVEMTQLWNSEKSPRQFPDVAKSL